MESEKVKEIKEALWCCNQNEIEDTCKYCSYCPASDWDYENECFIDLFQKTITLIDELDSENEKLLEAIESLNGSWKMQLKKIAELEKENLRLDKVVKHFQELIEDGKLISSEQLKQFAERLKVKTRVIVDFYADHPDKSFNGISETGIDETLKEFLK